MDNTFKPTMMRIDGETHYKLSILKAEKRHKTFSETIQYLIENKKPRKIAV